MQANFLHQDNNNKVILFFNGWGMDDAVIGHLDKTTYDIFTFSHYDDDFSFDESLLKKYSEIYLVAWSMGVWMAAEVLRNTNIIIKKAIAINGTLNPISDDCGIPVSIFEGTINNFSERNKRKFDRRMFASKEAFNKFENIGNNRDSESQLEELKRIYKNAVNTTIDFTFDKILIGKQDLIFPVNHQIKFWKGKAITTQLELPHFPFFNFNSWTSIIDG